MARNTKLSCKIKQMKDKDDRNKTGQLRSILQQAKNEIYQQQQLFIAQKAYNDALEKSPAPDDHSPEADSARKSLEEKKANLENLLQMLSEEVEQQSS